MKCILINESENIYILRWSITEHFKIYLRLDTGDERIDSAWIEGIDLALPNDKKQIWYSM